MTKIVLAGIVVTILGVLGWSALPESNVEPVSGAFSAPFLSIQLSTSTPTNGYVLATDGLNNTWVAQSGATSFSTTSANYWASVGLSFSTTSSNFYSSVGLAFSTSSAAYFLSQNVGNAFSTTSASYFSSVGLAFSTTSSDYWKSQRIVGNVSTSAAETKGQLAFWTTTSGSPATLGSVATSAPTVTAPITYSGTLGSFVGGVGGAFDCTSATASVKGCLLSADFTVFNGKLGSTSIDTSAELSGLLTNETGTGAAVFGTVPTLTGFISSASSSFTTLSGVTASTTNLTVSGISACSGSNALTTNTSGVVACGAITSSAGAWPFTPNAASVFFNQVSQSTTTQLHLGASVFSLTASNTSVFANASTTNFTVFNTFYVGSSTRAWNLLTMGNNTLNLSTSTNAYNTVWSVATSGSMSFGPKSLAPWQRGFFWFVDTDGTRPCIGLGGNDGGDSDWLMCRTANNNATSDDMLGIGPTTASTTEPTSYNIRLRPGGTTGIGSSTPSILWGNVMGTTTLVQNAQFAVSVASSTANLPTVIVSWNGTTTSMAANHYRYFLQQNTVFVLNSTSSFPIEGAKYRLELCQDGTGSRTATFAGGLIRWKNDATTTVTSTANRCSIIYLDYLNGIYRAVGSSTNIRAF